jgi:hypothetical protein
MQLPDLNDDDQVIAIIKAEILYKIIHEYDGYVNRANPDGKRFSDEYSYLYNSYVAPDNAPKLSTIEKYMDRLLVIDMENGNKAHYMITQFIMRTFHV